MAWTFGDDPQNSQRDAVRILIGDTDTEDQQLTDATVDHYIAISSNQYSAGVGCCRALQAKYSRLANTRLEGMSNNFSDLSKHYSDLAVSLERESRRNTVPSIIVGGDPEPRRRFNVGQFDNRDD